MCVDVYVYTENMSKGKRISAGSNPSRGSVQRAPIKADSKHPFSGTAQMHIPNYTEWLCSANPKFIFLLNDAPLIRLKAYVLCTWIVLVETLKKNSGIQVYKPQYSYLRTINHSYWSYVHQFSYLGGTTLQCLIIFPVLEHN